MFNSLCLPVIIVKVNTFFAFSIISAACGVVSTVVVTLGRANSANYFIFPVGTIGTTVSILSFIFGLCGAVVASYGMDFELCNPLQTSNNQYNNFNNGNQIPQVLYR